jgi:hypothetical protein
MKRKARALVILVLVFVLVAAFVPVAGLAEGPKIPKTYFTGESCVIADLDGGIPRELGNGKVHITGIEQQARDETSDPRTTGDIHVAINLILDPRTGSGPMWGTVEITNEQGSWSGQWTGRLDGWASSIRQVAHGSGAYDGLVGYWHYSRPNPEDCYDVSGYIVETGAGQ